MSHDNGGRDWSDEAAIQAMPRIASPTSAGLARMDSPLEPSEGGWPCWHLDSGSLAFRTGRECGLKPRVGGTWLQ